MMKLLRAGINIYKVAFGVIFFKFVSLFLKKSRRAAWQIVIVECSNAFTKNELNAIHEPACICQSLVGFNSLLEVLFRFTELR